MTHSECFKFSMECEDYSVKRLQIWIRSYEQKLKRPPWEKIIPLFIVWLIYLLEILRYLVNITMIPFCRYMLWSYSANLKWSKDPTQHSFGRREISWHMQIQNGLFNYILHFKMPDSCIWLWTICQASFIVFCNLFSYCNFNKFKY